MTRPTIIETAASGIDMALRTLLAGLLVCTSISTAAIAAPTTIVGPDGLYGAVVDSTGALKVTGSGGGGAFDGTASLASNVLTVSADLNGGIKRPIQVNDYLGSGSSIPDGIQITSLISGTGGLGTYGVSGSSANTFTGQFFVTGFKFGNASIDHNVIVANQRSGQPTISAGIEFNYNLYNVSYINNNYIDPTGILSGFNYSALVASCNTPTVFSGNINMLTGASLNAWSSSSSPSC